MSTYTRDGDHPAVAERAGKPLVVVVGYDGSQPSRNALDRAVALLQTHGGDLEVVFVAHVPGAVRLSAEGLPEVQEVLEDQTNTLAGEVRARLSGTGLRWHFQRRDGAVEAELTAAAEELRRLHGDAAEIMLVVGGPAQWYHHVAGSVASGIVRRDRFPLLVVP